MSELKECPFCGSREERPINHAEDCFLRIWAESIDAMYHDEPMPHSSESMKEAWNTRAERTCENTSMKSDQWFCSECAGNYDIANIDLDPDEDSGIPNYCPNCGAKVVRS